MTKGVSQTMWIVIAIVVFLVIALVVLTMFGTGVQTFASISQATSFCQTQLSTSCAATGSPPVTWGADNIRMTDGTVTSCAGVTNNYDPSCIASPAG